ncbi:hypothetical protein chiPu_0006283 [Chiloscyllium punctatum]|uniref:Uncharacterized protein n=1 Tax=Chiloscyllium punctatum TaxID=137246 RepID=A0A401SBS7_CHIPU|nr:hypothetical protein [Chiloscyllium punctatum]
MLHQGYWKTEYGPLEDPMPDQSGDTVQYIQDILHHSVVLHPPQFQSPKGLAEEEMQKYEEASGLEDKGGNPEMGQENCQRDEDKEMLYWA